MPNDATTDLIRALIENMRGAGDDWSSLAMVIEISGGRVSGTHGYAYSPDGTASAVASRPSGIKPAVDALLESGYQPGAVPLKILVQFDRDSGRYDLTFENEDASRWKVTPANIDQISEALRPNLG